jgi:chitin disaccharide deacetylase
MVRFIINADDYGMHESGDDAIVELIDIGVVTSTSAMVLSPRWPSASQRLLGRAVDVCLHLDFTSHFVGDQSRKGLGQMIANAWLRTFDSKLLKESIQHQIDRFEHAMQRPPVAIDSHQHVHQFPQVRDVLFEVLQARYGQTDSAIRPMLRSCITRRYRGAKATLICRLGAPAFAKLAVQHGFAMNSDFAGVYDFQGTGNLSKRWAGWVHGADVDGLLIACHVSASQTANPHDSIWRNRFDEYLWLKSAEFRSLLLARGAPMGWRDSLGRE